VSDKVYKIVENLRGISESLGGYMTIERVSSEIKLNLDVWSPLGNELELMKRVKNQLDPLNVLNKGRYVGGI
jgi:glycolate oxidase FAD binding subunit